MPLDESGWGAADPEPSEYRRLLDFLRDHSATAFQPGELLGVVGGEDATDLDRQRCRAHLETLVELGRVEKRRDPESNHVYYRIGGQVGDDEAGATEGEGRPEGDRIEPGGSVI